MPAVTIPDTGSTEIVPANYNRLVLVISNTHSTSNLHISFAGTATTNDALIPPGGSISIASHEVKHQVNGISSSGTITAKYSEAEQ